MSDTLIFGLAAIWVWGLNLYLLALIRSPRSRLVLVLGGVFWPVAIPLELAAKVFEHLARPFLEKVLP